MLLGGGVATIVLAVVIAIVASGGGRPSRLLGGQHVTSGGQTSLAGPTAAERLFSSSSVWNAAVPANASLAPSSAQLVAGLVDEVSSEEQSKIGPWIATKTASTPIYVVPRNQPTVTVHLDDPTLSWRVSLARAFEHVPIPAGAQPARGSDAHMTIWQPSTNRLWEFFHTVKDASGWHAAWGGAMDDVSNSPGYYTTASWPGAQANWGATATSLPVAAGVITLSELQAGVIDHALALDLPHPRLGVAAAPAQRSDGTGGTGAIPEGAHLRINPDVDLSKLSMPPLTRMIAVAAQRYGLIVRDGAPAISLFIQDPGDNAHGFWGKHGLYGGLTPPQLMASFPWRDLQVLPMQLHSIAPASKFLDH